VDISAFPAEEIVELVSSDKGTFHVQLTNEYRLIYDGDDALLCRIPVPLSAAERADLLSRFLHSHAGMSLVAQTSRVIDEELGESCFEGVGDSAALPYPQRSFTFCPRRGVQLSDGTFVFGRYGERSSFPQLEERRMEWFVEYPDGDACESTTHSSTYTSRVIFRCGTPKAMTTWKVSQLSRSCLLLIDIERVSVCYWMETMRAFQRTPIPCVVMP
jgi:hypothetical protein